MKKTHTRFKLSLLLLGPVHIGNGSSYSQKEYIYENGQYYFLDMVCLYKKMMEAGKASKFEDFMAGKTRDKRLNNLLKKLNFKDRDLGGYKVSGNELESSRPGMINQINQCVKDAYGNPYIPGSSLKGALRTILVNEYFMSDKVSGGVDDIFNDIRVSDSKPISADKIILAQKWDFNAKKNTPNGLQITREAIEPGTVVYFEVTTVSERAKELVKQLPDLAKRFYGRYNRYFLSGLPNSYKQIAIGNPLYLGGGSGIWTKANYHEIDLNTIQRKTPQRTKMKGKGVYKLTKAKDASLKVKDKDGNTKQMSLASNKDNLYEMGKCGFSLKEVSQ